MPILGVARAIHNQVNTCLRGQSAMALQVAPAQAILKGHVSAD
ncbi:MAG: hypothetical protein WA738_07455 [Candidatus Angelobacter sp.]